MKNILKILLVFVSNLSLSQTFNLSGDLHWGTSGSDIMGNVIQTLDGNKLIVGSTTGNDEDFGGTNYGGRDVWVIKLSPTNSIIWEKNYGGSGDDYALDVIQSSSNSFMVVGYSNSPVSGNKTAVNFGVNDVWVLKIDNQGNLIGDYTYGSDQNDDLVSKSFVQINPNKYILACQSGGGVSGNKTLASFGLADSWLIEIDSSGNLMNQNVFGGAESDFPSCLKYDSVNDNIFVGNTSESENSGNKIAPFYGGFNDIWILKLDANLNLINQQSYGGTDIEGPSDLLFFNEKLLIVGTSKSPVSGNRTCPKYGDFDALLLTLDTADLSVDAQYSFGGVSNKSIFHKIDLISNNFVLSGIANGPSNSFKSLNSYGVFDAWIITLDNQFNYKNNVSFGGTMNDVFDNLVTFYSSGEFSVYYSTTSPGFTGSLTCANYGDYDIIQTQMLSNLGLDENIETLEIYPNPTDGLIHLSDNFNGKDFVLLNSNGLEVQVGVTSNDQIDISFVSPGIYFLKIDGGVVKIIKN